MRQKPISDQIAIISKGTLLKVGTVSELKGFLQETVRVDIASGFAEEELLAYGKVTRVGGVMRVLTNDEKASRLASVAIGRKVGASVSPISLDDVFINLVGMDDDEANQESA